MTRISTSPTPSILFPEQKPDEVVQDTIVVTKAQFNVASETEPALNANMAVVIQGTEEASDAVEAALQDAGVDDLSDIGEVAVIEIPAPHGSDDSSSLFVVLWGHAVYSLTWLESLSVTSSSLPNVDMTLSSAQSTEVMNGVLATGNFAFGLDSVGPAGPYYSLTRWLAVASPARAAWDALDRFFLGMNQTK